MCLFLLFFFPPTGRITKVFISHLHGDHLFGLPGLLCTVSLNVNPECQENLKCVDIYGPRGLRTFLRVALGLTGSQLLFPYAGMLLTCSASLVSPYTDMLCFTVASFTMLQSMNWNLQLTSVQPRASSVWRCGTVTPVRMPRLQHCGNVSRWFTRVCFVTLQMNVEQSPLHPQEQPGRTISLDVSSDSYLLFEDNKFVVKAFRLFHRIPSFGFCVKEHNRPGRLKTEILKALGDYQFSFSFLHCIFTFTTVAFMLHTIFLLSLVRLIFCLILFCFVYLCLCLFIY